MTDITQLPSFVNWRDGTYDKYHFDITINEHELAADWKETFMIDEVPKDDAWEVFSTEKKIALEDLYLDNGVTKECTRHYMDITPRLHGDLKRFADHAVSIARRIIHVLTGEPYIDTVLH